MEFLNKNGALVAKHRSETLQIEAWGENSFRVRATMFPEINDNDWALTETVPECKTEISIEENEAKITNGKISATVNFAGVISFYKEDKLILREYYRSYGGTISKESQCLKIVNREFKGIVGGDYHLDVKFESNDAEKIYGMGQYQHPYLDLKGCVLELCQRNSQITVPFEVSSLGYGFLWNNPAVGEVSFGKNYTEWISHATKQMDYWITADDSPKKIIENYTAATGRADMIREDVLGLWQCKLRYRTQDEVLEVARKYKELGIKIDVIVIDFFHWTRQGDWKFDKEYWPDPKAMVDELHSMNIRVVVSVWPSVDRKSENFNEMYEKGLLMRTERGTIETYDFQGDCVEIDVTNPETRKFVWEKCKENYYDLGIDMFWLDNSEPDLAVYDFDNLRYAMGPALEVSNIYPQLYNRVFFDNEKALGNDKVVSLLRCAWAGSQKYGTLVWSGDVPSTFESLKDQIAAGLNMGLAGIPWWTTDIGGFMCGDVNDPDFKQLLLRWFEFAVFSATLRLHGDRDPHNIEPLEKEKDYGGGYLYTGQPNEMWSYGDECFDVMKKNLELRESLKPYIISIYKEAHENGSPLIRTMFYEFPDDEKCWNADDQYMFGSKYLVAPILELNCYERDCYLPAGKWKDIRDGKEYAGGQTIKAAAPIDSIPVFEKIG